MLASGQTTAVFDYSLAVRLGLQESPGEVGEFGILVNRAFGASDTLVYIPLMAASLAGLFFRRRWSLAAVAAVAGISCLLLGDHRLPLPVRAGRAWIRLHPRPRYLAVGGCLRSFRHLELLLPRASRRGIAAVTPTAQRLIAPLRWNTANAPGHPHSRASPGSGECSPAVPAAWMR